jgi:hypothetical protein
MKKSEKLLIIKEAKKCKNDFLYFAENYLKIVDKNEELVNLKLNNVQKKIHKDLKENPFLTILKSRQMGSSTYVAARFFHEALFNVNTRIAVIAHTHAAVKNIYTIYQRFYLHLPSFLKIETTASSANELAFVTGSSIKIGTANSQNFRGTTFSCIHASEAAFWNDMNKTIQSLFQTASNNPTIIVETTPQGLNDFYLFWNDENAYNKLFLTWLDHEEYKLKKLPKKWKMTDPEKEYISEHALSKEQINWFIYTLRTRCGNNIHTFKQEYPITAADAFIASGTFVFPHFAKRLLKPPTKFGWKLFRRPNKYKTYILGIDTASGSPDGDFSAAALIDITERDDMKLVATFYDRVTLKEYSNQLQKVIEKYKPLVVCERNSYGQAIIEELRQAEYPYLYTETKFDKLTGCFTNKLGFYTSASTRPVLIAKLVETITSNKIQICDDRLQYEFMNFIYNEKGKAEAEKGFHDDLIFGLGLALMGVEQAYYYEEEIKRMHRPINLTEVMQFEVATGCPINKVPEGYFADPTPFEEIVSNI